MKVITTEKKPIKMWLENIEDGALDQAKNLANLPFTFSHVAIMPDSHQGYGMPIGGVLATEGVIIPNAVGVDIGCGMCAVKTSITELSTETLKAIMGDTRKAVPVGFTHHQKKQDVDMPAMKKDLKTNIIEKEFENALTQVGTLGGGNHFIEFQKGSDGHIWLMIHSGSRNFGLKTADFYNKLADSLNTRWRSEVPKKWELAFLPLETDEGQQYLNEMQYCVEFALLNRKLMMDRIMDIVAYNAGYNHDTTVHFDEMINIAHNYARMEHHFGRNVIIHRKGATLATDKTIGIIPGSQGTASYIVKGKGNPDSFQSCSHGAGRKMGRKQAQRTLSLEDEKKRLDEQGVLHAIRGIDDLDEAAGAYKDIDEVMRNQTDLVETIVELKPLGVIKG